MQGVRDTVQGRGGTFGGGTSAAKVGRLSGLGDRPAQLLDVFHGVENLADAGRAAFESGMAALEKWLNEASGGRNDQTAGERVMKRGSAR